MRARLITKALMLAQCYEGSHSFTCHHVYSQEDAIPAFTPQPQSITALGRYSFLVPHRI